MAETIFGIDKGIIKAFVLMIIIVGALTTFFLSEYISTIILGSVFQITSSTLRNVDVVSESVTADNFTAQILTNFPIAAGTLTLNNGTAGLPQGLGNFTIVNADGSILLNTPTDTENGSTLIANYTYIETVNADLPISDDAFTFVATVEDDWVTTFTSINTAVKFAAALITVVAVILVFASFLPKKGRKEGEPLDF